MNTYQRQINLDTTAGLTGAGTRVLVIDTGYDPEGVIHPEAVQGLGKQITSQHGTWTANLLHEIAPGAEYYIANAANPEGKFDQVDVADAINWGVTNGVDVMSISVAGKGFVDVELSSAVASALASGIEVVAAMGNAGITALASWPGYIKGVHSVGAVDAEGAKAPFSQSGTTDIFAPGTGIEATGIGGMVWANLSGTSFSTPIVAASMLLMLEAGKNPNGIYNYMTPVEGETSGVVNIGFATHTGNTPMLHTPKAVYSTSDDLSVSYLVPEQDDTFNVSVWVEHDGETYSLDSTGGFVLTEGAEHEVSFYNLQSGEELTGSLFGYQGIYDSPDLSTVDTGEWGMFVEVLGQVNSEHFDIFV